MLASAGYLILDQRETIGTLQTKNESLQGTITHLQADYEKISKSNTLLQAKDYANRQRISEIKEKAIKDVTRVENIAKRKSKLYEKLVNQDFKKSQKELEVLTK